MRARSSSFSDGEWATSKRSCTAVETLFTFWPPGPEASTKLSLTSSSPMEIASLIKMRAIARSIGKTEHLFRPFESELLCVVDGFIGERALVDVEPGAPMRVLRHGVLRPLRGQRDGEGKRGVVEREGRRARHRAGHIGDAIVHDVVQSVGRI